MIANKGVDKCYRNRNENISHFLYRNGYRSVSEYGKDSKNSECKTDAEFTALKQEAYEKYQ